LKEYCEMMALYDKVLGGRFFWITVYIPDENCKYPTRSRTSSLSCRLIAVGLRSTKVLIINLSLTYKIVTTWSLFNPCAVPTPRLLSPFFAHQPSPHWKSLIAHLDVHNLVFGINFRIHFVSLTSFVSIYLHIQQILPALIDFCYP